MILRLHIRANLPVALHGTESRKRPIPARLSLQALGDASGRGKLKQVPDLSVLSTEAFLIDLLPTPCRAWQVHDPNDLPGPGAIRLA